MGLLLERIAVELRDNPDAEIVRGWFDEAVELRNQVLGLAAALEDLRRNRRWNFRVTKADLAAVQAEVDACQTMSTRALSLASDLRRASTTTGRGHRATSRGVVPTRGSHCRDSREHGDR